MAPVRADQGRRMHGRAESRTSVSPRRLREAARHPVSPSLSRLSPVRSLVLPVEHEEEGAIPAADQRRPGGERNRPLRWLAKLQALAHRLARRGSSAHMRGCLPARSPGPFGCVAPKCDQRTVRRDQGPDRRIHPLSRCREQDWWSTGHFVGRWFVSPASLPTTGGGRRHVHRRGRSEPVWVAATRNVTPAPSVSSAVSYEYWNPSVPSAFSSPTVALAPAAGPPTRFLYR